MNLNDIPTELKGIVDQYQQDMESIDDEEQTEKERGEQVLKDTQNPELSLDHSEPVKSKKDDDDEKEPTEKVQFKSSSKNLDLLKSYDYTIKSRGREREEPEYFSPDQLTSMKLSFSKKFPNGVNVQIFDDLRRKYPRIEDWINFDVFKRLDLSNGSRNKMYFSRVTIEDSGMMSNLKEDYFYDAYGDTLLVACTLFAIDENPKFKTLRTRYERDISKLKEYFELLSDSYNQNIDDILTGLLEGRCSTYDMPIFIEFIHKLVVGNKGIQKRDLKTHRDKLLELIQYLGTLEFEFIEEVPRIQVTDIISVLVKES